VIGQRAGGRGRQPIAHDDVEDWAGALRQLRQN
jgi:hypothetical protein